MVRKTHPNQNSKTSSWSWKKTGKVLLYIFLWLLFFLLAGGVAAVGAGAGMVAALVKHQEVYSKEEMIAMINSNPLTTTIYFRDGRPIGQLQADEDRKMVTLDEVPDHLKHAFIATEDRTFYTNPGVDIRGLTRAVLQQLTKSSVQTGGSTITQQLVKNAVLEDSEVTYSRKAREILLAMRLNRIMSKTEILTAYLNEIYFGISADHTQIYGVQAAAKGIFGVDVKDLNLAQSAYIAGMAQNPANYSPFLEGGLENGKKRQQMVLGFMLEEGYITQQEYEEALQFPIENTLAKRQQKAFDRYPALTMEVQKRAAEVLVKSRGITPDNPQYAEALNDATKEILRGGYHITTTIDKEIYDAMQEIARNPDNFGRNRSYQAADGRHIEDAPEQLGAVLIENQTGAILGMIEGRGFEYSQVNFATSPRQPGSAMKPLAAYAPALEMGKVMPATILDDSPVVFEQPGQPAHVPVNHDNRYHGLMTARRALDMSYNIPALKVFNDIVGIREGLEFAERLGIQSITERDKQGARTGVIGGLERGVSVEEMTNAFATFANGGNFVDSYLIESIKDHNGQPIYTHTPVSVPVMNPRAAWLMTDMLKTVVTDGTGRSQIWNKLDQKRELAGKTGTTNRNVDLWFIGYTPKISLGLWAGYEINHPMSNANLARQLWVKVWNRINEVDPELSPVNDKFERPEGVVQATVCSLTGALPNELCQQAGGSLISDWFDANHLPSAEDDKLVKAKVVVYKGQNYLPQATTPEDMLIEGIFVRREPFQVPPNRTLESMRPEDWDNALPTEEDPRTDDGAPPSVPANLRLQGGQLIWNPNSEEDVVGYRIYQAEGGSENFTQVGVVLAHQPTQFAIPQGVYAYRITAVDVAGNESALSEMVINIDPDGVNPWDPYTSKPEAPAQLGAVQENGLWIVKWSALPPKQGVKSYRIYLRPRQGEKKLIDEVTQTQIALPGVTEGFISVTAVNDYGESPPSKEVELVNRNQNPGPNPGTEPNPPDNQP